MQTENNHTLQKAQIPIDQFAAKLFDQLSFYFPVCMASDEFHFFPQIRPDKLDWSKWDDFSSEAVSDVKRYLYDRSKDLNHYNARSLSIDDQIDISLLKRIIKTIFEQLEYVKPYQHQPTFYLTILAIGIGEAVESGQDQLTSRIKGLPRFIDHARINLVKIPEVFRDLGCEMTLQLIPWLQSLPIQSTLLEKAVSSLYLFNNHLTTISLSDELLVSQDLYEQIAFHHMGCYMNLDEISRQIDTEIDETRSILETMSSQISPQQSWKEIIRAWPRPKINPGEIKKLYQSTISDLADHCSDNKLCDARLKKDCPVEVQEIPDYLLPVRSNAAYSMPPAHPPKGGVFFIMGGAGGSASVPADYQLLTAHETYPGHHLLDTVRWRLKRFVRRHLEFPIFYEGWASFSEELLFDTGFFSTPMDTLLLAKRRYFRAVRGRIDLDIHTRKRSLREAALFFEDHGMERSKTEGLIKRYILKPGYQLSYAIGRFYFRGLYDRFKTCSRVDVPSRFTRVILSQGEIDFKELTNIVCQGGDL